MCFISVLSPVFLIKKKIIGFYSCSYRKLGEDWKNEDSALDEVKAFTYATSGHRREAQVHCVQTKMLKKMVGKDKPLRIDSKVDLARLPPYRNFLLPHVQRVNYRDSCYKEAQISIFELPKSYNEDQGRIRGERNIIEPPILKKAFFLNQP